jgi:hypothetical protein
MQLYTYTAQDGTSRTGKLTGKTSAGKLILEDSETGNVYSFDKKEVKEVLPYTVEVTPLAKGYNNFHVEVKEGSVKVGSYLLYVTGDNYSPLALGVVSKLNTNRKLHSSPVSFLLSGITPLQP